MAEPSTIARPYAEALARFNDLSDARNSLQQAIREIEHLEHKQRRQDVLVNAKGDPLPQRPNGNWPLPVKPMASPNHFVCMALGNFDNDPFIDVWAVNWTSTA